MEVRAALIVGGGEVDRRDLAVELGSHQVLIGVDGGALVLEDCGVSPDWVVGDFDSLDAVDLARLERGGARVLRFPCAKDQTDLEIALETAAKAGVRPVTIFGATGTRLDHTLTNLGLLRRAADLGLTARMRAPGQEIILLKPGLTTLAGLPGQVISFVPLTMEAAGIATDGLRYPLRGESLFVGASRGVHNEFLGRQASVSFSSGELLVFIFGDAPP